MFGRGRVPVKATNQVDAPPVAVAADDLETRFQRLRDLYVAREAAYAPYRAHPVFNGSSADVEARVRHGVEREVLRAKWDAVSQAFNDACEEFFLNRDERKLS